jgi:hypothetical protein
MTVNTIEGLRVNQWGAEGVTARATLTMDTQPTANDTVTVGPTTYTFKASPTLAGEIARGANLGAAQTNFVAAINGDSLNAANPVASAAAFSLNACVLTARIPGTAGNSIPCTETFTAVTNIFDAAVFGTTRAGSFARGTAVAATSKMAVEKLEWDDADEKIVRPEFANGLLLRNRGHATAVEHGTRFSIGDQPLVWEQFLQWLTMAINGQPTVTYVAGSPNVYRSVFTRDPTANPNLLSYTLERRFSDGNGTYVDQQAAYAMLEELSLKYAVNDVVKFNAKGFARKFATSTITGALNLPTTELGVSALSRVYVDDVWGSLGGSLLAEQVIGWEFTHKTGAMPLMTAEGRTSLDFTKHQIDAKNVTLGLKLTVLLDPTTYATESAKAAAADPRAVRILLDGSGGRVLKLDGLFQYTKPALFKIGSQDGQDIVDIELEEYTDGTNFLKATFEHPTVYTLA